MTARDLLRTAVIKTNRHWPFIHCNHWPYTAALSMFCHAVRGRPEVYRAYLRRVLRQRPWVPGVSDIDLALIVRSGMTAHEEYRFLEAFWRRYARLKRVFPMLGEVAVLDEEECPPWLTCTGYRPAGPEWTLVHGLPGADLSAVLSTNWRQNALGIALWLYKDQLPLWLSLSDSLLIRQQIQRRVRKILWHLEPILADAGQPLLADARRRDTPELMADALRSLDAAAAHLMRVELRSEPRDADGRSLLTAEDGTRMLIIEDGLAWDALVGILRSVPRDRPGGGEGPIVLSRRLLTYLARHYNPYDYSSFVKHWVVPHGRHPLAQVAPPEREHFFTFALHRIASFLLVARGEELFSQPLSMPPIEGELNRVLRAMLVLRAGWISTRQQEVTDRCRVEFPEWLTIVETIRTLLGEHRLQAAREAAFGLFHSVASDARDVMFRYLRQEPLVVSGSPSEGRTPSGGSTERS